MAEDSATAVFEMLGFQYKPVEKDLLRRIKGTPAEKMYKTAPPVKKIRILEWHANNLGL